MPLQAGSSVENNFIHGLQTEATGLNFPENACTETYDCTFEIDGSVKRRLGFDFESSHTTKNINRANCAITRYVWRNVAGNGDLTLIVIQIGPTLYFYKTTGESVSGGAVSTTVTLTPVSGAPTPDAVEAQYSDGNGLLFVTHPYCDPMRVSYDTATDTATATTITLKIRDFEGATADVLAVDSRPTATLAGMDDNHEYNLRNQGWNTTNLTAWDTAQTTMPSNSDVMWRFKDSSDNFDASTASIARVVTGNTPASKGHYTLTLANQDRDTAAGTTGVAATTTGSQRPSTSTFFTGRVFYSGINYINFNSKIYFTQIVERPEQYAFCYQTNDPTAEDTFDLLPSDGGSISIPEAGTIYKLVTIPGGILAHAGNGVWFITGSTGIGFTATDYSVQKISTISTLTASSFVDVMGFPTWWNAEGIYTVVAEGNLPVVKSLTDGKIKTYYDTIPLTSKRFAQGFYHYVDRHVHWLFRSSETSQITEQYEYDRVLNLNVRTGAFYPWRVTDSNVKIHAVIVSDTTSGSTIVNNVIDGSSNNVIDASGNQVIAFQASGTTHSPFDKYLVSYPSASTYAFTFAEESNDDYVDWFQYDLVGVDYDSYFVTGYKLRGEGLRKFQNNWIRVFSRIENEVAYFFQGIWDYALTGDTGRWSSKQYVNHTDDNYGTTGRRLKIRGHGIALQFRVESVAGKNFDIVGWSTFETGNQKA